MKLKRNYLLFLCLFFLKGYDHAFAVVPAHSFGGFPVQVIQSKDPSAFDHWQNLDILPGYALLNENDDDDDCTPVRKKTMVSRCAALNTIFFLSDLSHSFHNNRRSYERFGYLSHDRYLFQRVLRV